MTPVATDVRRLFILLCGYEVIPRSVSIRGAPAHFVMAEPICAYLLDTARGWVLFDTGLDPARLRDPVLRQRHFIDTGWLAPPIVLPEHELLPQLKGLGLEPRDIGTVVLSHAHCDHTGHLKDFRHASVHIQRREHALITGAHGNLAVFDDDLDGLDWRIVEGDWELMPGIRGLFTPGHMPGHQSLLVELPQGGPKILTADAGDLRENYELELPPGECPDPAEGLASIRKLKALREATGAELVLLHDPNDVHPRRLAPDFYD